MMRLPLSFLSFLWFLALAAACTPQEQSGVEGNLLFGDRPVAGAQVEAYLRSGKERSSQPFAAVATDRDGRYRLPLPAGRYFLIARKKEETEDGRLRMLMGECPTNPVEVNAGLTRIPPIPLREMGRDGTLVAAPGTGVRGRLVAGGRPVAGAFVYVYTEASGGLVGPSYGAAVRTAEDGSFHLGLPPGRYFLAARKRADGARAGEPAAGDLNGSYPANPVAVAAGETVTLADFPLQEVDAAVRRERLARGKFEPTLTAFTGRVVDPDGRPLAGIYVFGYLDRRMTGKPTCISAPTGADGRFQLYLGSAGTYYVGARSAFGGPLEPGERVGTYDGDPLHAATAVAGKSRDLGDLTVREVW